MPTYTCDAAVVGAGAAGSAAALALSLAGWKTVLVAPSAASPSTPPAAAPGASPQPDAGQWDTRVFALSPASRALLDALGAWPLLPAARLAPVYRMQLLNRCTQAAGAIELDAYRAHVEALAWIVENDALESALSQALAQSPARRVDARVTRLVPPSGLHQPRSTLELDDGSTLHARLVVASDGRDSALRRLAHLQCHVDDRDQTSVVTWFEAQRPHRDTAWQWFTPRGVLALLPLPSDDLPDGRSRVSLVWSLHAEHARALLRDGDIAAQVGRTAGEAFGALRQCAPLASFAIRPVRCARTVAPGFVAIGDAAHAVHPMAGQGMNLGLGDVAVLMQVLRDVRPARFDDSALWRYERTRKEAVRLMQFALDGLDRVFRQPEPAVAAVRDLGWQWVARSPWLQRQLVRHAIA